MRWLHISDIHIDANAQHGRVQTYRRHFLDKIDKQVHRHPVDCIIFTGDLFSRGKWDQEQIRTAQEFLKEIYQKCSNAGAWNWHETEKMERLFYCPGNHDVLREAYSINHGVLSRRRDVIDTSSKNGLFSPDGDEKYNLLTEGSFGTFEYAMNEIISPDSYHSSYPFEYKIFNISRFIETQEISIIGINTALIAGQEYQEEQVAQDIKNSYNDFLQAHTCFDTQSALKAYGKYHLAVKRKLGHTANDQERLCFISKNSCKQLDLELANYRIPIFFGHHPLSFLSPEAQEQFNDFLDKNYGYIYLCGHMHKASGNVLHNTSLDFWDTRDKIHQITVGGIFLDNSGYNRASFAIGEVSALEESFEALLKVSVFTFTIDIFNNERWEEDSNQAKVNTRGAEDRALDNRQVNAEKNLEENPENDKDSKISEQNPSNSDPAIDPYNALNVLEQKKKEKIRRTKNDRSINYNSFNWDST